MELTNTEERKFDEYRSVDAAPKVSSKEDTTRVSIILIDYNEFSNLQRALPSIFSMNTSEDVEVIVVDNGSTDGSVEYIHSHFQDVKIVPAGKNLGYSGANNLGAKTAQGEYLIFLNPDTTVTEGWISNMLDALKTHPNAGMVTPKILMMGQERINTCGNDVHFTGYGYLRGWMAAADSMNTVEDVFSISGCSFMIRKQLFDQLGGFDEAFYPIYVEDTDLSWRARLAGYDCLYVPDSVIYHDYTMGFGSEKYFRLERNRYQMLIKNLHWGTLFLLLPSLLLSEVVSWGYVILRGAAYARSKLRSYAWLIGHLGEILRARQGVQALRQRKDIDILRKCTYHLAYDQANDGFVGKVAQHVFDPLFHILHRFYLAVISW